MFSFLKQESKFQRKPWMESYNFVLATEENIDAIFEECASVDAYALDLETTGLDVRIFPVESPNGKMLKTTCDIVGLCLAAHTHTGYYIPLRHAPGGEPSPHNIPWSKFEPGFRKLLGSNARPIVHNGKFEGEILTFNGTGQPLGDWDRQSAWDDTLILAYLENPARPSLGLKVLSKELLGKEQIELEELFPEGTTHLDFSLLDPLEPGVLEYGASDAICTLELYYKLKDVALELTSKWPNGTPHSQAMIYAIEKACVPAVRWMERARLPISLERTQELIQLASEELVSSLRDVYVGASEILGRNITPLSFYLFDKELKENNPDMKLDLTDQHAPTVRDLIEDWRKEATRLQKMYDKGDFGVLQMAQKDATLQDLLSRPKPPAKGGVALMVEYDVLSSSQLGVLLHDLDVPDLQRTETGQIKTSKDVLDDIINKYEEQMPFLRKLKKMRGNDQALKNLNAIWQDTDRRDNSLLIQYRSYAAATGRFSAKGEKYPEKTGGTRFNLQSMPSGKDPKSPESLLRIRECIHAREGKMIAAIDYSGQELRILANLTMEPKWIKQFFSCSTCKAEFDSDDSNGTPPQPPKFCPECGSDRIGDIHTLTGLQIWGEEAASAPDWKFKRETAKRVNFALNYGGGASAIQRQTGVAQNEAYRIVKKFNNSYQNISSWWGYEHAFARKHKYVITAFERKFPLPDIDHKEKFIVAKAERNAVNSPIQGCMHPESRVMTSHGYVKLQDLWDTTGQGKDFFDIWTGTKWSTSSIIDSGMRPLSVTTLSNGQTLRTSPDHRFLVYRNGGLVWVAQEDLIEGDWMCANASSVDWGEVAYNASPREFGGHVGFIQPGSVPFNNKGFSLSGNSEVMWEFLGLVYGDGSIRRDGFVVHVGGDRAEEVAGHYVDFLSPLGVGAYCKKVAEADGNRKEKWQVCVYNTEFRTFCERVLGVGDENTYTKRFPRALWRESVANRAAFLRGYFGADGTFGEDNHISVRSANHGLLQDTLDLLCTLGIRASKSVTSLRVAVHDKEEFRSTIGFSDPRKKVKLDAMEILPSSHVHERVPASLSAAVGSALHDDPAYGPLPRGTKSHVIRLMNGSGSKRSCIRFADMLKETPPDIRDALKYNYVQVTGTRVTGEEVRMFDIQVIDSEHAFVCDGVVTHNCGADLTKIAMGCIYAECKRRGWLDKVHLIITMHDELVFEIDKDILEEAVEIICHLMTSNKLVLSRRWKVPLTVDVEIGYTWAAPWDIKKIQYLVDTRRALQNPNLTEPEMRKHLRKLDSVYGGRDKMKKKLSSFEDIRWPDDLVHHFKDGRRDLENPLSAEEKEALRRAWDVYFGGKGEEKSEKKLELLHTVRLGKLTPDTAHSLASLIHTCKDTGKHRLAVVGPDGRNIQVGTVMVDPDAVNRFVAGSAS